MAETISRSQRLHEDLGRVIAETPPGDRLLTEPVLARQLGVSRATLREAMRTFETQGLIRRRQGSGTYVVRPPSVIESGLETLESIETLTKRMGLSVTMGELKVSHRPSLTEEAAALDIEEGAGVLHLSRVILAEGRAAAFLDDILPEDVIAPEELESGFTGSVLDLLLRRGDLEIGGSRTEINADTAKPQVARALGIQRGDVLLHFKSQLYTTTGRIIALSSSYFLPGYFRFHVIRRLTT